jgi:predicted Zn-dependent protease
MDRLLTKTLAEIYLQQGHLQEAYVIFKSLSEKNPLDTELQDQVRELEGKLGNLLSQQKPVDLALERKKQTLEKWLGNIRDRRTG